ncbi:MAG TPA: hypothetical protein VHV32_19430 [Candidatus Angelobacter sp.]|jgi:hypothetical protein|nr:hypothetical protein [Candidatus Angelobacter sp.]
MTDYQFHVTTFLTILAMAATVIWTCLLISSKVSRALGTFEAVLKNFPPHRHINGTIVYPDEYEPTAVQTLYPNGQSKGAGA